MRKSDLFTDLLNIDSDDLIKKVAHFSPTQQKEGLEFALSSIRSKDTDESNRAQSLMIAQTILTEGGQIPDNIILLEEIDTLVTLACRISDRRLQNQALIVASLLAQRIQGHPVVPESVTTLLDSLSPNSSLASSLNKRLNNVIKLKSDRERYTLPNLDIERARANVIDDARQDWFQDPWKWPELERASRNDVLERLENRKCGWTFAMDVPKSSDGTRPALIMDPNDRIAFQCLADELSLGITSGLPHWVFGWRVSRSSPQKGLYENNSHEWKSFKQRIAKYSEEYEYVLRVDVRQFFESIEPERLLSDVGRYYKKTDVLFRLSHFFEDLHTRRNGHGLPQRSLASSILAHVPLYGVDRFLSIVDNEKGQESVSPLRWMDDIWLFGNSESRLRSVSSEIQEALSQNGLGLNPNKTVFEESHSVAEDLLVDSSGIDDAEERPSDKSFSERILEIVNSIGEAPRSDISFMLNYKGDNAAEVNDRLIAILREIKLDLLDHAADRVAGYLCKYDGWRDHLPWYMDNVRRQADTHSWGVAAWGNMFPELMDASKDLDSLNSFFIDRFNQGIQQSLVPLAAHRIIAWSRKKDVIELLLSYLENENSNSKTFIVRAVALAAKQAGLSKDDILLHLADKMDDEFKSIESIL